MTPKLAPIFLRLRYVILTLLLAALVGGVLLERPSLPLLAAIIVGAGVALVQFRYGRLAWLVALAPLPGLSLFAPTAYAFAFALAALMAAGLADKLLRGAPEEEAFAAQFDALPALLGALAVALGWSLWDRAGFDDLLFACLSVLLAVPVGAIFLPFGEHFHLAANRARERRAPLSEMAARLAQPRWTISFCGIALVFAMLGLFEAVVWPPPADWLGAALVGLVLLAIGRDKRAGLAGLVSASLLLLYGQGMNPCLLLFALLALFLARRTRCTQDGNPVTAWARTLEDNAVPTFFAGLGAALAATILNGARAGALEAGAAIAALLFFPALTLALHHLLPRRRSVAEIYKS